MKRLIPLMALVAAMTTSVAMAQCPAKEKKAECKAECGKKAECKKAECEKAECKAECCKKADCKKAECKKAEGEKK